MTSQRSLGELAEIVRGISFPKEAKSLEPRPGDIACLRTTNVQRQVEWGDLWFVPAKHVKREEQYVRPGDILISTANSYELVGKVALVAGTPRPATLGAFISLIRARNEVDPKFLYHQLAWGKTQSRIRETASTTTNISNVSTKKLAALELEIPPLPDQRRIVAEIEKQFFRLDEAVANLKRVKANLKRYKAAVLKAAVEGRLVPTEAELARREGRTYESAAALLRRILDGRRSHWNGLRRYKEPANPTSELLPELPEGWARTTVDQLIAHVTDGDHQPPPQSESGVPFLVIGDVRDGEIDFSDTRFVGHSYYESIDESRKPRQGDLLYTLVGSYGIPVRVRSDKPFCVQRHIAILRPHPTSPIDYLSVAMASDLALKQATACATGTAQLTVPLVGLRAIAIPLPPLAEQRRIVAEVDRRLSIFREVETALEENISRAHALRQAVLGREYRVTPHSEKRLSELA